jgi:hypothetical protein
LRGGAQRSRRAWQTLILIPADRQEEAIAFGREPENAKDLHCKLTGADNLSEVLAWREERTVTKNLSMS